MSNSSLAEINVLKSIASNTFFDIDVSSLPSISYIISIYNVSIASPNNFLFKFGSSADLLSTVYETSISQLYTPDEVLVVDSDTGMPIFNNGVSNVVSGSIKITRLQQLENSWIVTGNFFSTDTLTNKITSQAIFHPINSLDLIRLTTESGDLVFSTGDIMLKLSSDVKPYL